MAAVGAGDEVVAMQGLADADRDGLLAHVEVGQARHLRALVQLVHLLLEGPDLRHLPEHVQVLLQLHPRVDHLGRHCPTPSIGLGGIAAILRRRPPGCQGRPAARAGRSDGTCRRSGRLQSCAGPRHVTVIHARRIHSDRHGVEKVEGQVRPRGCDDADECVDSCRFAACSPSRCWARACAVCSPRAPRRTRRPIPTPSSRPSACGEGVGGAAA